MASFIQRVNTQAFIKKEKNRTEPRSFTVPNPTEPKDQRTITPLVYMLLQFTRQTMHNIYRPNIHYPNVYSQYTTDNIYRPRVKAQQNPEWICNTSFLKPECINCNSDYNLQTSHYVCHPSVNTATVYTINKMHIISIAQGYRLSKIHSGYATYPI